MTSPAKDDTMTTAMHRRLAGRLITGAGALAIAFATLIPASSRATGDPYCLVCGPLGGVDALLNLGLFVPLGLGLALLAVRPTRALGAMSAFAIVIELLQLFAIPNRDASFGDVVMNSAGGAFGFVIGTRLYQIVIPTRAGARRLLVAWSLLWIAAQTVAAYAAVPVMPRSQYYGHLARPSGTDAVTFEGEVIEPVVDVVAIPDGKFSDSREVRALLTRRAGAVVRSQVVAFGRSAGVAPIIRIVDDAQRELLVLAQDGTDVVFGVRTGADVLRLRSPRYRLRDVFVPRPGREADSVMIDGGFSRETMRMSARRSGGTTHVAIVPSLSQAWRLVLPAPTYAEPGALALATGMLWNAALAFAIGYWFYFARETGPLARASNLKLAAAVVAVITVGIVGIPAIFAITPARWWEWGSIAVGLALGALCAARARNFFPSRAVSRAYSHAVQ